MEGFGLYASGSG